jgi:hypothetical protein
MAYYKQLPPEVAIVFLILGLIQAFFWVMGEICGSRKKQD